MSRHHGRHHINFFGKPKLFFVTLRTLLPWLGLLFALWLTTPSLVFACDPTRSCCAGGGAGGTTCGGAGPASNGDISGTNQGAGNPIHLITGNKYQREIDLPALPGVLGLEVVRHYNSVSSGKGNKNSLLGRGWKLGYETDLFVRGETIEIVQADGTSVVFIKSKSNPDIYAPSNPTLGRVVATKKARGTEHIWTWTDGRQLSFDTAGRLVQIAASTGEFVSLQHDARGWLVKVTDPQGRSLHLSYPRKSADETRFLGVASIDTPVGRFAYEYGSTPPKGSNVDAASLVANLTKVSVVPRQDVEQKQNPDANPNVISSSRLYHYENAKFPTLLTGISVKGKIGDGQQLLQRLVTWNYDDQGRANLSVKGEPARYETDNGGKRQLVPGTGIEQVTLQWQQGKTILTNSLGQQTVYTTTTIAGEPRILESRGAGCATCGPANVRYAYDQLGRLIEQTTLDGEGNPHTGTRTDLDGYGRPLRMGTVSYQRGKPQVVKWNVRYEYAPESSGNDSLPSPLPTLIAHPSAVPGNEHIIRIAYNKAGQATTVTETGFSPLNSEGKIAATPAGAVTIARTIAHTYTAINGRSLLTQIDGPLPNGPTNSPADSDITRFEWNSKASHLQAVEHPMGLRERFTYEIEGTNAPGRLVARTGVNGVQTTLTWNTQGRVAQIRSAGVAISLVYDLQGRAVRYQRSDGAVILAAYDDTRYRVSYTLPDGEVLHRQLDSEGRLQSVGWQLGDQNKQGNSTEETLVSRTQVEYDLHVNRPTRWTDPSGVVNELTYDAQGRVARQTRGELTATQSFDPAQHLLQVQGNKALVQSKNGGATGEPDKLGDQNSPTQAQSSLTLPNGATHRQWADDFGRVVRLDHPDTGVHRAAYDAADRQTDRWDSGRHSSARYDALGRLTQLRHANTGTTTVRTVTQSEEDIRWQYVGALLVRQTSSQQDKHFAYDVFGRVTEERLSLRRQASEIKAAATSDKVTWLPTLITGYGRDAMGRVNRIQLPEGAVLTQIYDAQGRIGAISLQDPATRWWQTAIRWVWAEQGTRALITQIQTSSSRGLRGYQHGNGSASGSQHDKAGRLTQWRDGPQATALGYNSQAQLSTLKKTGPERPGPTVAAAQALQNQAASQDQNLRYDAFGRLTQVSDKALSQAFDYDHNGNRLWFKQEGLGSGSTQSAEIIKQYLLAPASDRLQAVQTAAGQTLRSYQYNEMGEAIRIENASLVTPKRQQTLHYNSLGQIASVDRDGQLLASYAYNGARQRIAKTIYGTQRANAGPSEATTTYFTWHGGLLDAEIDAQGRVQRRTIHINLRPVAQIDYSYVSERDQVPQDIQRYAIHGDHLGTPQAITDESQRVVWAAKYDSFGRARTQGILLSELTARKDLNGPNWMGTAHAAESIDKQFKFNLRFAGQYEDDETGWYYNWHRYYEPETGRYLTPDPIGLSGGNNAYGYAGGDPLGFVDPWGLYSVSAGGTTTFHTGLADLPTFSIPTPTGWEDYSNSDLLYHEYNKLVGTNELSASQADALRTFMINHPTPNTNARPATPSGVSNTATPNCGPFSSYTANLVNNDVTTYLIYGVSRRPYVVNVTRDTHVLRFGIVIRGVRQEGSRTIVDNYGEGSSLPQAGGGVSDNLINNVWYWATERGLESVTRRPWTIGGRDWTAAPSRTNSILGETSCSCGS